MIASEAANSATTGGALIPMYANYIMGLSKKVAHDEAVAANWENDGEKATERWWFA